MKERIEKILRTLEGVKVEATFDNLNRLLGITQELYRMLGECDDDVHTEDE